MRLRRIRCWRRPPRLGRLPCGRGLRLPLLVALLTSCAGLPRAPDPPRPQFAFRSALKLPAGDFEIWYDEVDQEAVPAAREALKVAAAHTAFWGPLRSPVVVRLYPSHAALEAAVHRYDYPWLRAWARYDEIFLQSPTTYSVFERGEANLTELLTHELTHCRMYQQAASRGRWRRVDRQIPIWFREGMASWTAEQGKRRVSEARLERWMHEEGHNPLIEADALYRDHASWVYGAAHWAFSLLVEQYSVQSVQSLLDAIYASHGFGSAFKLATGLSLSHFQEEWRRYLLWEGWRERAHPAPQAPATPIPSSVSPVE